MYAPRLPRIGTHAAWRTTARQLARARIPAHAVDWGLADDARGLFDRPLPVERGSIMVPAQFADLTRSLIPERSGRGMTLAYALLTRLQDDPKLLSNRADPQVAEAREIAKSIHRDLHKMHAFVRFREAPGTGDRRAFESWFEPDHRIEEPVADFFVNRFGDMDWTIITPEVTISYIGGELKLAAVASLRPDLDDPLEELWSTYYANIFNPARLKPDAMRAEMPMKYWRNLPEARLIPSLIADARNRTQAMQAAGPTLPAPQTPRRKETLMSRDPAPDLFAANGPAEIARDLSACTRCPLHGPATQAVMGEGPAAADLMIVGEQPGDQEDIAGRPFVGPAGQLFDEIAATAGLDRGAAYVTNAVKHFKFVQKGRRRIHQRPAASEISACRWWLEQELATVDPKLVVAMGATALHALTGNGSGILKRRGTLEQTTDGRPVLITLHPSYILRVPNDAARATATENLRADLERAAKMVS